MKKHSKVNRKPKPPLEKIPGRCRDGQIFLGTFYLGHEEVDLIAITNDSGGSFYFIPEKGKRARIKVSVDYKHWPECISVLLHEVFEFAMTRQNLRLEPCSKFNRDSAWFTFIMNHDQFGHICACAADFVTPALPELSKAWKKFGGGK